MPSTYNGVGTHYHGKRNIQKRPGPCPHCHRPVELTSYDTRLWFVVFFIPIIPLGRKRIVDYCPACTRHYPVDLDKWETAKQLEISGALDEYRAHPTPEGAIAAHQQLLKFHQTVQAVEFQKTMTETYAGNAKVQAYLGAALDHVGNHSQAAEHYARALELRPDLPEARIGVARGHIRAKRLDEARKLLDFLEKPGAGQLYSLGPLETLAIAYENAGRYADAYDLFSRLLAELPKVGEIKSFRDRVKKLEAALRKTDTILPKMKFSWRRLFTLQGASGRMAGPRLTWGSLITVGIILVVTALGFVISNEYIRRHRTVYIVNAYQQPATVEIKGVTRVPGVRGVANLVLPEGRFHAIVTGPVRQELDIEIAAGYFSRWFSDPAWVINIGGDAALTVETAVYRRDPPPVAYDFRFGNGFEYFPKITNPFTPLPETLQMNAGESRTLVGLSLTKQDGAVIFDRLRVRESPQAALHFAECWLRTHPSDKDVVNRYHFQAVAQKETERADKFLEAGLTNRPVLIAWHRAYQELHNVAADHSRMVSLYDAMLAADPTNSALLYLRGRVAWDRAEARQLFQRAVDADSKNPYPSYALGYDRMMAGDWPGARPLLTSAVGLDPQDVNFVHALVLTRLALGEYTAVEKEMRERSHRQPIYMWAELMLINALAAQGRRDDALSAVSAIERDWNNRFDASSQRALVSLRLQALYAVGDFTGLQKAASSDASPAGREALAQALIEQGHLDEAAKLHLPEAEEGKLILMLTLAAAFQEAGDAGSAAAWRAKAGKGFEEGSADYAQAAKLLAQTTAPSKDDLEKLVMPVPLKSVVAINLAQLHPDAKPEFLAMARLFNVERTFPYHFVERLTKEGAEN